MLLFTRSILTDGQISFSFVNVYMAQPNQHMECRLWHSQRAYVSRFYFWLKWKSGRVSISAKRVHSRSDENEEDEEEKNKQYSTCFGVGWNKRNWKESRNKRRSKRSTLLPLLHRLCRRYCCYSQHKRQQQHHPYLCIPSRRHRLCEKKKYKTEPNKNSNKRKHTKNEEKKEIDKKQQTFFIVWHWENLWYFAQAYVYLCAVNISQITTEMFMLSAYYIHRLGEEQRNP